MSKALKGVKLLAHEKALLDSGLLTDITHSNASSVWLDAPSTDPSSSSSLPTPVVGVTSWSLNAEDEGDATYTGMYDDHHQRTHHQGVPPPSRMPCQEEWAEPMTTLYRPVGDTELEYLVHHNQLPDTQTYQAVLEGEAGRNYAEKYLTGAKKVDTSPTTVIEFVVPKRLVDILFSIQRKCEDGCMSMGLGDKAGNGLPIFNEALLKSPGAGWRVVRLKRSPKAGR